MTSYLDPKDYDRVRKKVAALAARDLMPSSHLYQKFPDHTIGEACKKYAPQFSRDAKKLPALQLLAVVLAANRNYNRQVRDQVAALKRHPSMVSFKKLKTLMEKYLGRETDFKEIWGHKDPHKFATLYSLLASILGELTNKYKLKEYVLLARWAREFNMKKWKEDPLCMYKVGLATLQHLRMSFGADTCKPDRRVKQVLHREFGFEKISEFDAVMIVHEMAQLLGEKVLYLDLVFVNYGSGYYYFDNEQEKAKDIAKRLKQKGVRTSVIDYATLLTTEVIDAL